jgi:hypothetical protein
MKLRAINALLLAVLLAHVEPLHANEKPPQGSKDASCTYLNNSPEFCKVRINQSRNEIIIWTPATRESAKNMTYRGQCLKAGCTLVGPDLGYPERTRVKLLKITKGFISWRELNYNKAIQTFTLTDY